MENKPRILIEHNYYKIPGGEETVVANEKKLLEDNGHEVFVYTRSNEELDKMSKLSKLFFPFRAVYSFKTSREIGRIIKKHKIDIVHVHNTFTVISPSVYYAARKKKVPVVQTVHNFRLMCPAATFYRDGKICEDCVTKGLGCAVRHRCYHGSKLQTKVAAWILRFHRKRGIYKKINYICLTEFNRQKLAESRITGEAKIYVKPNFTCSEQKVLPYAERENYFVYIGRLDKLKGIDVLLGAWKRLGVDAPPLKIFGSGPEAERCAEFVAQNGLTSVTLAGQVENAEAMEYLSRARALILPTRWYEGFPMVIAESLSLGTPVIVSDLGNAGSLICEGVNGWKFGDGSEEELCEAVKRCRDIVDSTAATYAQYSAEENYRILSDIYDKVLADRNEKKN